MNLLYTILLRFTVLGVSLPFALSQGDPEAFYREIEDYYNRSLTYVFPRNNAAHLNNRTSKSIEYGTFDFVIIGGGTAGGVLATRLTERKYRVLVLEAGKRDPPIAQIIGLFSVMYNSDFNWGYNTTKQKNGCLGSKNQQCIWPRGKGLGGCSAMDVGIYVRGHPTDFDSWGVEGWSYKDILPYFKKAEKAEFTVDIETDYHGLNGPQRINTVEDIPVTTQAIINAYKELGKVEGDYNGKSQYGISRMQFYLDKNIRSSVARAYVNPVESRKNLNISLESFVTRLLIANKTITGVEFVKNGQLYVARASKEVILSAGAINSPQILMLSGIGPADELKKHKIPVIADLPVGKNLLDQPVYSGVVYRTNQSLYNNTFRRNLELWRDNKRPLTPGSRIQTNTFYNFEGPDDSQPEIMSCVFGAARSLPVRYQFIDSYRQAFQVVNDFSDFTTGVALMYPKSVGSVKLQSSNPRDFPLIDPNYFDDPSDLEFMWKGIQAVLELNNTKVFRDLGIHLVPVPLPNCAQYSQLSKEWWMCSVQSITITLFNPLGTTAIGNDKRTSVVDKDLKVHGTRKLRVVDAGSIPVSLSGNLDATVVMMAEKISEQIKAQYPDDTITKS